MFPYHDELDAGINLPVVISQYNIDHSFDNKNMQDEFFEQYNVLFEWIDRIKKIINNELVMNNLNKMNFEEEIDVRKRIYYPIYLADLKQRILEAKKIKKEIIKKFNIVELEQYLKLYGKIIDELYELKLCNMNHRDYIKVMELFNDGLLDIGRVRKNVVENFLPNTWFITSEGHLYNVCSSEHSGANFNYYYEEFQKKFFEGKIVKEKIGVSDNQKIDPFPEFSNPNKITEDGYVGFNVLDVCLHYHDYIMINNKNFDQNYKKIIRGMLEIRKDYYKFLKQLLYTKNPNEELRKIIDLTGDNYDDFLIRCCGVSKITNSPARTIITSFIDYKTKFKKYIEKGWNIVFISPIVINEKKGIIEEYTDHIKINHALKYCKSR